jgi:hypothetical protein
MMCEASKRMSRMLVNITPATASYIFGTEVEFNYFVNLRQTFCAKIVLVSLGITEKTHNLKN